MKTPPEFHFRIRETGAAVFRLSTGAGRIEMDEIAVVNVRTGNVRPHGDRVLTEAERATIADWVDARRETLARRDREDAERTIDRLNLTAHWAQGRASDADLDAVTDRLLLAMHDLRAVLVRKRADKVMKGE
jgi:hypothetical protein